MILSSSLTRQNDIFRAIYYDASFKAQHQYRYNYATVVEVLTDVLHHGMAVGEEGRQLTIAGLIA